MPNQPERNTGLLPELDHLATEWDTRDSVVPWRTAITLAEMSTLAYSTPHNRELVLRLLGCDKVRLLDDGPRSGFVAGADEVAVVAFRGTDDLEDWFINLDFRDPDLLSDGRTVHRGFKSSYDAFGPQVMRLLDDWSPQRIWITGHSLGGAMAACCAVDLIDSGIPFAGLVTFGQPRIGNNALATQLDHATSGRYMRFVNEDDAVPLVPPGLLWDYWHCGSRVRFRGEELDRWHGLAVFSCSGPPAEGVGETEPAVELGDGEESLSETELREVQDRLRARKTTNVDDERVTEVDSGGVGLTGIPPTSAATNGSFIDGVSALVSKRIADHSMTEYLRRLNEWCDKEGEE